MTVSPSTAPGMSVKNEVHGNAVLSHSLKSRQRGDGSHGSKVTRNQGRVREALSHTWANVVGRAQKGPGWRRLRKAPAKRPTPLNGGKRAKNVQGRLEKRLGRERKRDEDTGQATQK